MTTAVKRVSMNPSTFTEGAKLDDVDVTVKDARYCFFDYKGKTDNGLALCLGITLTTRDGKDHDEFLSAGDKEFFRPSTKEEDGGVGEGGGFLVPIGNRDSMSASTNAALFIRSLTAAGYPVSLLDQHSISQCLTGLDFHIAQQAQPKRTGLVQRPGQEERKQTYMTVAKVNHWPAVTGIANSGPAPVAAAAKTAATPAQAAVPAAAATAATGPDPAIQALCEETLIVMLAEAGGKMAKKDIASKAFLALKDNPNKKIAVPIMFSDAFLSTCPNVRYNGSEVEIA